MRVTVYELQTSPGALEQNWDGLVADMSRDSRGDGRARLHLDSRLS